MSSLAHPAARPVTRLFARDYLCDALGLLDIGASPEVYRAEHLLGGPVAVVVGAPWLGKSPAARQFLSWLRGQPPPFLCADRLSLCALGEHGAEHDLPPPW